MDWQCCLAGSSKMASRILILSIAMDANYSFYVKTVETHAHVFLTLSILAIGGVFKVKVSMGCSATQSSCKEFLRVPKMRSSIQRKPKILKTVQKFNTLLLGNSIIQGTLQYNSSCYIKAHAIALWQ